MKQECLTILRQGGLVSCPSSGVWELRRWPWALTSWYFSRWTWAEGLHFCSISIQCKWYQWNASCLLGAEITLIHYHLLHESQNMPLDQSFKSPWLIPACSHGAQFLNLRPYHNPPREGLLKCKLAHSPSFWFSESVGWPKCLHL